MVAALRRDLRLTAEQAAHRLRWEEAAMADIDELSTVLGARFGGAWMTRDGERLVVAVTEPTGVETVRARGAQAQVVRHSQRELDAAKARLDRTPPSGATSWYVDVEANTVAVRVPPDAVESVRRLASANVEDPSLIRIEVTDERLAPTGDLRGGNPFATSINTCSIGFSVVGGFVTAGHCANQGGAAWIDTDPTAPSIGTVAGSVFSGVDMAWIRAAAGWTPRPRVSTTGADVRVASAREAPVNASVCRSGRTTGWHCGRIKSKNVTARYPAPWNVTVNGLTSTTVCAEPGDSGGPYVSGSHAQGVLSGSRITNCPNGGDIPDETYFQRLQPILDRWGLTLEVAPGTISRLLCDPLRRTFWCTVSYDGTDPVQISWTYEGRPWPAWNGLTRVHGGCGANQWQTVTATITHADGTDTASDSFQCEGNQ